MHIDRRAAPNTRVETCSHKGGRSERIGPMDKALSSLHELLHWYATVTPDVQALICPAEKPSHPLSPLAVSRCATFRLVIGQDAAPNLPMLMCSSFERRL
jgi:hypothetical protein